MTGLLLLQITLVLPFPFPPLSWAAASYEDSLKQLAEDVTERAAKAKKQRLAVLDFTDSQGEPTPVGQFLAEELGTQIMVAGELTTVDRTLLYSTMKKMQLEHIDPPTPRRSGVPPRPYAPTYSYRAPTAKHPKAYK